LREQFVSPEMRRCGGAYSSEAWMRRAAVIFQDAVHLIGTREADCAEQSSFRGTIEWTLHNNARPTVHSRGQLAKRILLEKMTLNSVAAEFKVHSGIPITGEIS
jgi:hypothetical protein